MRSHETMPDSPSPTADQTDLIEPAFVARVEQFVAQRESLAPALAAYAEELPAGRHRRDLRTVVAKLQADASAADLCRLPNAESTLLPLLSVEQHPAEAGKRLNERLNEARRDMDLQRQRRRVLCYPLVILLLAIAVIVFLCVVVVPVFRNIFAEFGLQLSDFTLVVLALSNAILSHPVGLLFATILVLAMVNIGWRVINWSGAPEKLFGYLISGNSRELLAMATFFRRLSESLAAQLPLPVALRTAGRASNRRPIQEAANRLAENVEQGVTHLAGVPAARRFPKAMTYLLTQYHDQTEDVASPGNAAQSTVRMLDELAEVITDRVRNRFDWSSGIVAQFSLILVGVLVATVLLSLLLPLVTLVEALA